MKNHIILTSALMFATFSVPASAQVNETNAKTEVLQALRRYDEAWQHGDTVHVKAVLSDGYIYFTSHGDENSKDQSISTLASPKYVLESVERSEIEVRLAGSTAIVSSRWRGHGTWKGKPFIDDQRCGLVFQKTESGWKLLAEHCTQIEKP